MAKPRSKTRTNKRTNKKATSRTRAKRSAPPEPIHERLEVHEDSPTAVAAEAWRAGTLPPTAVTRGPDPIPGRESDKIRFGDPDVRPLENEYSGEESPGADQPTPDQGTTDAIGAGYGVEDAASGALRSSGEVLEQRDRRRKGLRPPRRGY